MSVLRRLTFASSLAVSASSGHAEESGPFSIVDHEGKPVAAATVTVVGRNGSSETASDGTFRLQAGWQPPLDLAVFDARGTLLGIVHVESADLETRALKLPEAPSETVTVRAGIAPSTWSSPAAAATLYGAREREQERPDRLADVLDEVPGAGRLEEGQTVVPAVRGLSRGRTLLLIDDGRITAERRAGPSGGYIDPFIFESVEIVRGPGSVAYGSDAIGGVLHVRTPIPDPEKLGGRAEVSGGWGSPMLGGAAEINVPVGSGALLFSAHARSYEDYDSPEGEVFNSASDDRGALLRGGFPAGSARLSFGLQVDRGRDEGKPAIDSTVTRTFYPREDSERLSFGSDWSGLAGFEALELRVFAGAYRLVTDRDTFATPTTTRVLREADVDAKDAAVRLTATRAAGKVPLRMGVDLHGRFDLEAIDRQTDFDATGAATTFSERVSIEDARALSGGLFLEAESPLLARHLTLAAGGRGDVVTTDNIGGTYGDLSTSEVAPSGYLAATVRIVEDWSVTLQAAAGFRDPSLSDRYFVGASGRGTAIGNPDLDAETSEQYDLAVRGAAGPMRLAAYAYLYRIDDLVERYRDDLDPRCALPAVAPCFFFRNRNQAEIQGVELEASFDLTRTLAARLGVGAVRGEIVDDGSTPNDIPPDRLTFSLVQTRPRWWWRATAALVASKDDVGPTEAPTPSYGTLDASAGVKVYRDLEVRLHGWNLTDETYPATTDAASALAPGRAGAIAVAVRF
jgi:hemoglobin/transferrin/lactoferrin receptor protein